MNRIVIVRHGNTFLPSEPPRRIGARVDLDLTAAGVAQAELLGRFFGRQFPPFDRALASPLLRARHTADLILRASSSAPPLVAAPWLIEIDHGPDEGEPEEAVVARIGHGALEAWDEKGVVPPGWLVEPDERQRDWRRFFASRPAGNSLIVTSNGVARFALLAAFGDALPSSLRLRTGAFGIIAQAEDGALALESWDQRP